MYRKPGLKVVMLISLLGMAACSGSGGGDGGGIVGATLQSIAVPAPNISIDLSSSLQLSATGTYSDNSVKDVTTSVTWSSSDTTVATVGASTGLVTPAAAASAGDTVVITATSGSLSATTIVTLKTLQFIAVTPGNPSVALDSSVQLTATAWFTDSTSQDMTTLVTWSSSDPAVAIVGANTGLVTPATGALAGNAAVITAASGTQTGTTTVTLTAIPATLQSVAVTPQNPSLALDASVSLTATGTYSDSSTQNITSSVTWSSANPAVAVVGATTGLVTPTIGATVGQTVLITATSGTQSGETTVTLTPGSLAPFDISDTNSVTDPLAAQQWGLRNTAQTGYADTTGMANTGGTLGTDINVNPVYQAYGYTGTNIIVAVVDSGLEIAHEDLSANVVSNGSYNFNDFSTDPTNTVDTTGDHGTEVGGLIAMAKNGIGGIGVAPKARLKGFNFLSSPGYLSDFLAALGGSTANPDSSDVMIFNQSFGMANSTDITIGISEEDQYAYGTSTLRGGKGALYVKSAGNGFTGFGAADCAAATDIGVSCQNANFDPANTLPYNIVMAALNAKGKKSSYSTAGSAVWTSTPGGEYGYNVSLYPGLIPVAYDPAMVTTDQSTCTIGASATGAGSSWFSEGGTNLGSINLNCNYTNNMNGTSSAAPMMSGIIALILEANPSLTWREVKDILAKTAVQVDAFNPGVSVTLGTGGSYVAEQTWFTNAAGYKFHNWYGFGAVNASAAVNMAKTYPSGSLGTFANTGWISSGTLGSVIPDDNTVGASVALSVPRVGVNGIVEAVQIEVTTTAPVSGFAQDLGIELISPSGTKSILKNMKDGLTASSFLAGMVLASNAFYGESSAGAWTAKVVDGYAVGEQTLTLVRIRLYGH